MFKSGVNVKIVEVSVQNFQIHCHHCKQWLGESSQVMRCIGLFESPRDRERIEGPRDTWHCKKCGWVNVFRPAAASRSATIAQEGLAQPLTI